MGKGKKSFIDRKSAVTFHLVHRSQHDPLVTDENAPQRVLVEAAPPQQRNADDVTDKTKRQEELRKYGIHYDDDYDYLQHLKKPEQEVAWEYVENPNNIRKGKEPKINLPSSVFATEFEEEEGMLNKAAPCPGPRLDWDPEVVAALDDDFDFDNDNNILEDDFVVRAMDDTMEDSDDEENNYDDIDSDNMNMSDDDEMEAELMDRLGPLMRDRRFADEETKSRFTEYSMSSSVIRRNEQLSLLDDRFEKFYSTYDDPELGDLPLENIEGSLHQKHPYVMSCLKEFKKKRFEKYDKQWDKERLEKYRNVIDGEDDPNEELVEYEVNDPKDKKWDCESILSTCTNIYNHPKLIEEPKHRSRKSSACTTELEKIQIDPKTGHPMNILRGADSNQLTMKTLSKLNDGTEIDKSAGPRSLCAKSVMSTLSVLSIRPDDETAEEKRERKRLLKDYRNERRIERKANAQAFKDEKKRQTHIKINQNTNQQGTKIL